MRERCFVSSSPKKPEYLMFKIRRERAESLLHSYNYHVSILKAAGYPPTGMLPKFFEQVHDMLNRKDYGRGEDV